MAIASTPLLVQKSAKERRKSLQRSRSIKEDQIQVDVEIVQEPDHLRRQLTSDGDDTLNKVNSLEQDEDMKNMYQPVECTKTSDIRLKAPLPGGS